MKTVEILSPSYDNLERMTNGMIMIFPFYPLSLCFYYGLPFLLSFSSIYGLSSCMRRCAFFSSHSLEPTCTIVNVCLKL